MSPSLRALLQLIGICTLAALTNGATVQMGNGQLKDLVTQQSARTQQGLHMQAPSPSPVYSPAQQYPSQSSAPTASGSAPAPQYRHQASGPATSAPHYTVQSSGSAPAPQYKYHSEVVKDTAAAGSGHGQETKTHVGGFHNEIVSLMVEVFGLAIIPIILLPVFALGLLYLLWSRSKGDEGHYAFDNGATYGGGSNSHVIGYDYPGHKTAGHHRRALAQKTSELTARVLPNL